MLLRPNGVRQVAARLCRRALVADSQAPSAHPAVRLPGLSRRSRPTSIAPRCAGLARARYSSSASSATDASTSHSPSPSASAPETLYAYFPETFPNGPPPTGPFAVDARGLRREFLALQAAHHPDKQPPSHKPAAEAQSAAINHAYRTLVDPLLRAQYLLSRRGVDVAADEDLRLGDASSGGGDGFQAEDRELLLSVMESHEVIEEASHPSHLDALRAENDARVRACEDDLARAFAADDIPVAKRLAIRLRYWVNIRNAIHDWEEGKPPVLIH